MEEPKEFGYALGNRQVRVYRTNSFASLYRAVVNNIQEYLRFEGVVEERGFPTLLLALSIAMISLAGMLFKFLDILSIHTQILAFIVYLVMVAVGYLEISAADDGLKAFQSSGEVQSVDGKKESIKALRGHRFRILVSLPTSAFTVHYEAQLVGLRKFLRPAVVTKRVKIEVPMGKYFSKNGQFYPPALISDVDDLLQQLISS